MPDKAKLDGALEAAVGDTLRNIRILRAEHNVNERFKLGISNQDYPEARGDAEDTILFDRVKLHVAIEVLYRSPRLFREGIEQEYERKLVETMAAIRSSDTSSDTQYRHVRGGGAA